MIQLQIICGVSTSLLIVMHWNLGNPEFDNLSSLKKEIHSLKTAIKNLGDVNVNAIEEYKEVNERYIFS